MEEKKNCSPGKLIAHTVSFLQPIILVQVNAAVAAKATISASNSIFSIVRVVFAIAILRLARFFRPISDDAITDMTAHSMPSVRLT